uniref:Photosystem I protein M n=1 Tax=Callitris pyramidalis TaxID=214228 RepID=A0A8F8X983_9CONI|nr:photosystem I protein M [Callitris pyramidalis]
MALFIAFTFIIILLAFRLGKALYSS